MVKLTPNQAWGAWNWFLESDSFNFRINTCRGKWEGPPPHRVSSHSRLLEGNYIDETVRQWLICAITHRNIPVSAFSSSQRDVQLLTIDQRLHCVEWNGNLNSFHPIEFQPITIDIWHMLHRGVGLPVGSWWTGWQFGCLWKREEKCKSCLWMCSHTWCEGKRRVFFPPHLNLVSTISCLPPPTRLYLTLGCPYFLLIIMWITKVRVHETHINHLWWAYNEPELSHCSPHKLRSKYSQHKLGMSLPPAEFIVTCLSLKTSHLQGSQLAKDAPLPQLSRWPLTLVSSICPGRWRYVSRWHAVCFESPTYFL